MLHAQQVNLKTPETEKIVSAKRPNIIYIMADDLTTQAISAYGGIYKDIAPTPNIDKIAKQGMLFQDVLVTNAIFGPSRAAILTGNYSNLNGYYKNESGGKFNVSQWTFSQELKAKLKNLIIKFEDDKSLADFRKITDTDFGRIVDNIKDEESIQQILIKN